MHIDTNLLMSYNISIKGVVLLIIHCYGVNDEDITNRKNKSQDLLC